MPTPSGSPVARRLSLPAWPALLLAAWLAGCSGGEGAPAPVDDPGPSLLVELVDRVDAAGPLTSFPLPFAPLDPARLRDLSPTVDAEPFGALDPERARILDRAALALFPGMSEAFDAATIGADELVDEESGGRLLLSGPRGFARILDGERGRRNGIALRYRPGSAAGARFAVLEVPGRLMPVRLESEEWLLELLGSGGSPVHFLETEGTAPDGLVTAFVDFRPRRLTRAAVFVALVPRGSLELDHLQVHATPRCVSDAFAESKEFTAPWVRRIEIDRDFRESILLPAPGTLELELDLPAHEPRLSFELAPVGGQAGERVELLVHANAPGLFAFSPTGIDPVDETWRDVELDLSHLAGQRVKLRFEARAPADGRFRLLALGEPVIAGLPPEGEASLPPDVILISLDTVRADRLSLYGADVPTSPNLERLAEDAFVFESAVTTAPWTLPSHMSVFTGRYPGRHGITSTKHRLRPGGPHLATDLRRAGYRTVAFTGGGYVHPDFGFGTDFERYGILDVAHQDRRVGITPGSDVSERRAELLRLLREPRRRPLFLWLHSYVAHNYTPVDADLAQIGADPSVGTRMPSGGSLGMKRWVERAGDRAEAERLIALLYDSTVVAADALIGDVVAALRDSGRFERSIVVVFSDHGEELFEHGRHGHCRYLWEELVRVPLLVKPPAGRAGRSAELVSLVDVAPTLHELLGLPGREAMDGRSLLPVLAGGTLAARPVVVQAGVEHLHSLRDGALKLIVADEPLLYDLASDPRERANRAAELAAERARLSQELNARLETQRLQGEAPDSRDIDPELERELDGLGYTGD